MKPIKVSASILSADFGNLLDACRKAEAAGVDMLHMDVMDGHFVPNITFGAPVLASLKGKVKVPMDAHLMIENADKYIPDFIKAGAGYILFHAEAIENPVSTIHLIRQDGCKAGMVLNPGTSEEVIKPFVKDLDYVLFMSVWPGFSGQSFIPDVVPKIARFSKWCGEQGFSPEIAVDGGISPKTAPQVVEAGANLLIAATAIFKAPDMAEAVRQLKTAGNKN
ncbi:MAG TPA: ribulose-phosphate 3-epimerase [bacterium]|nr:ribulose-phosphate 3-epimerase [bacterium]